MNAAQFEKLKSQIQALESTNNQLDSVNDTIQAENANLQSRIQDLEAEAQELHHKFSELQMQNETLQKENVELEAREIPDPNPELKNKIAQLIEQKNELLEQNISLKNQKLFAIQIHSIDKKHFELTVPSSISGKHIFQKEQDYTQDQIHTFTDLAYQIDNECPDRDQQRLEACYNKKILSLIDPRMSNADYRKNRPNYFFSA